MAERVVLHVGTMKSGTTYLQRVLTSGVLEGTDAFYPGERFGQQTKAVRHEWRWRALAEQAAARHGTAVFSQEFLSFASRPKVEQLVAAFDGTPVEVVLTVRDQHRAVPAQWQSYVRNRGTDDWDTYLRNLSGPRHKRRGAPRSAYTFYRAQGVETILRRWRSTAGVTAATLVVVPPSCAAPDELWHRFCDAARIGAGDPPVVATRSNESLGFASCDVMRRLNVHLDELPRGPYKKLRRTILEALLPLRNEEGRPELDQERVRLAGNLNLAVVDAAARHDARVVGSTDELPVHDHAAAPPTAPAPDPEKVRRALQAVQQRCLPDAAPGAGTGDLDGFADRLGRDLVQRHR